MKPFMYILSHIDHLSMDLVQNPRCSLAKVQSINQSFYIHEHAITCILCEYIGKFMQCTMFKGAILYKKIK